MSAPLPRSVPVSGSDWFMLAMDRARRARVGHGNICHLVLDLEAGIEAAAVEAQVRSLPVVGWLASLRVERPSRWGTPRWTTGNRPPELHVRSHTVTRWEGQPQALFADVLDASSESLVTLDLLHGPDGRSMVVWSWHHALMDARGGELLARLVGGLVPMREVLVASPPPPGSPMTLSARLAQAKQARDFVFGRSLPPMDTLQRERVKHRPSLHHALLELTGDELVACDRALAASGAGFLRSAFLLACVARAVHAVLRSRGKGTKDLLVPVPQDQRPRGQAGPLLSNQLGILFYRLSPADLVDVPTTVRALGDQLRQMLKEEVPAAFGMLLAMCRSLPLDLYLPIVLAPTLGKVASFGFSDAGDGLAKLDSFLGVPVRRATHYPANIEPPGFTVVASRMPGRVVISTAWMEGALRPDELALYQATLRADLLGTPA